MLPATNEHRCAVACGGHIRLAEDNALFAQQEHVLLQRLNLELLLARQHL